jgi:penicillin amidase
MELPHSRGGTRGWIVSANNEPLGLMRDGSADGDPFYFGVFFDPGVRAARIEEEIERLVARGGVTIEEMQTLQDDTHSEFADDLVPELATAWGGRATDAALVAYRDRADLDALVTLLGDWDRRFERTSSAAVVFHGFNFFLARRVLADDFSLAFDAILGESPAFMFKFLVLALRVPDGSAGTFLQEGRSLLVVQALEDTAAWLTTRFGGTDPTGYAWGDVHFTCFGAVVASLDGGCVSTDGGEGTVNVSGTSFFGSGGAPRDRFESHGGSIYRLTATFTPEGRPQAFINFPRGVSGEPSSPYWNDRTDDWVENRYRELLFERAEIEADASSTAGGGTITIAP